MDTNEAPLYYVWGVDLLAYGPVELPTLVKWVLDERVEKDTWVYDRRAKAWCLASDLIELKAVFSRKASQTSPEQTTGESIRPASLRRIKVLAELPDDQLQSFGHYLQVQRISQHTKIVSEGDVGDSMFMLLEGELRARVVVHGKESILSTMEPGESFGELALLDEGKRSADVVANVDSTVLKISRAGLKKLFDEAPALAAPFMHALCRTTAARLRVATKRIEDTVRISRTAG